MIFTKSNLNENFIKDIASIDCEFIKVSKEVIIAIDSTTGTIYISKYKVPLSEDFTLIVSKGDFIHLMSVVNEVEIKEDGSYKSGRIKGTLNINNDYVSMFDGIGTDFDVEGYNTFIVTENTLVDLKKGSIFADPMDANVSFRAVNIKDGKIFSSSNYRIFLGNTSIEGEYIFDAEVVKHLSKNSTVYIGEKNTVIVNDNESYCIRNNKNTQFIPITEDKMAKPLETIRNSHYFAVTKEELAKAINYITYYAKSNTTVKNNCITIKGDKTNITVSVKENSIDLVAKEPIPDVEFEIPISVDPIVLLLSKFPSEEYKVFFHDRANLIIIQTKEGDEFILTKIKNA